MYSWSARYTERSGARLRRVTPNARVAPTAVRISRHTSNATPDGCRCRAATRGFSHALLPAPVKDSPRRTPHSLHRATTPQPPTPQTNHPSHQQKPPPNRRPLCCPPSPRSLPAAAGPPPSIPLPNSHLAPRALAPRQPIQQRLIPRTGSHLAPRDDCSA
jgi:hypothetical protein